MVAETEIQAAGRPRLAQALSSKTMPPVGATVTLSFSTIENKQSPPWDYGFFDVSRFELQASDDSLPTDEDVIQNFIGSPTYQRSFCESPDPWGAPIDRHGPFPTEHISNGWYQLIAAAELPQRIEQAINDAGFDSPPDKEQMRSVNSWVAIITSRGDTIFALVPPEADDVRVEWAHVWFAFTEFICVDRQTRKLEVAVIGYD